MPSEREAMLARSRPRARSSFYWRWVLACTLGELVGIGVAAGVGVVLLVWLGEPQSLAVKLAVLVAFGAVGVVEGGALAAFEWRVLRTRIPRLRIGEWLAATVTVAVAGWLLGMTPSLFLSGAPAAANSEPGLGLVLLLAAVAGAGAGLCFGVAQWVVLRRHVANAGRWIWIHVPAWALAMAAIFLGASLPGAETPAWAIAVAGAAGGVLGGLCLGAVTGLVAEHLQPWVNEARWSLAGKVCAVTGANSGIGKQVAWGLARLGASVILLCRRPADGDRVRSAILAVHPAAKVTVRRCDLSSLQSIRDAAGAMRRDCTRLDVLVHNAGATFLRRTMTGEGIEATLAVDVVGPFLLTALLRGLLEAVGGRVITLTGLSHRRGHVDVDDLQFGRRPYDWQSANSQAQRGRWLFTSELARRAPRLTAISVHPGAVRTRAQANLGFMIRALMATLARPAFVRPEVGAIPVVRLAARPGPVPTGRFFNRCLETADTTDQVEARRFWSTCERLTGVSWPIEPGPVEQDQPATAARAGSR